VNPGRVLFDRKPYKGVPIDEIAATDKGLLYLDRTVDKLPADSKVGKALRAYLKSEVIQRELNRLLYDE